MKKSGRCTLKNCLRISAGLDTLCATRLPESSLEEGCVSLPSSAAVTFARAAPSLLVLLHLSLSLSLSNKTRAKLPVDISASPFLSRDCLLPAIWRFLRARGAVPEAGVPAQGGSGQSRGSSDLPLI